MSEIISNDEGKFRALIENSSEVIIILNEEFTINFVGPSINKILGYDTEYYIGKSVFDFIHQDEKELTAQFLKDTLHKAGRNKMVKEILIKNNEGKFLFFEIVAVNMLADPVIGGILVNGLNITERKMAESELINTNFELDSFVYKASHDLKAPLRSMMGLIKLAKLESKDPNLTIYLDMMNKSIVNLDVFIKDLTQFSRNSRMEIESTEINFEEIISESLQNLKYLENARTVTISKKIDIHSKFCSDVTRISTIINNLISNAFKYHRIENNSPYINILINAGKNSCEIVIEDNGSGIDPSQIGKIYEMFYRASEGSYGSGLGLYIVKSAVSKLNGTIEVMSELNKGSKFIVTIPNLLEENEG